MIDNDDMYEEDPFEETLLTVIGDYDRHQRKRIKILEAKNKELLSENAKMLNQALRDAQANSGALLKNILSGTFDNIRPTDSKEQLLSRITTILKDFEIASNMVTDVCIKLRPRTHSEGDTYAWNGVELQLIK